MDPADSEVIVLTRAEYDDVGAVRPLGEINWDCPCLQGMAHGPCGPDFRSAFSCFVHSTSEAKGEECSVLFATMKDCFDKNPEHYEALRKDPPTE